MFETVDTLLTKSPADYIISLKVGVMKMLNAKREINVNENEAAYFVDNDYCNVSTIYIDDELEKRFGVEDIDEMLQEEEKKMISGNVKYYALEEVEKIAKKVIYG